jgi:hypothetical protein
MHEYLRNANEAGRTVNIFQLNYMFFTLCEIGSNRCSKRQIN